MTNASAAVLISTQQIYYSPNGNQSLGKKEEDGSLTEAVFNETNYFILNSASELVAEIYSLGQQFLTDYSRELSRYIDVEKVSSIYQKFEKPIAYAHFLNLVGVLLAFKDLYKSTRQLIYKRADKKIDAVLSMIHSIGAVFESSALTALGGEALKLSNRVSFINEKTWKAVIDTTATTQPILEKLGVFLASISLAIDARNWWKTRQFLIVYQSQMGTGQAVDSQAYKNFQTYVETLNENVLSKIFLTNGKELKARLKEIASPPEPTQENINNLKITLKILRQRLKKNVNSHSQSAISNLVCLAANGLIYSGIAAHMGLALTGLYAALMARQITLQKADLYKFEERLGLFYRDQPVIDLSKKREPLGKWMQIKDFTKWGLGYYKRAGVAIET